MTGHGSARDRSPRTLAPARWAWLTFVVVLLAGALLLDYRKVDADFYTAACGILIGLLLALVVEHRLFAGEDGTTAGVVYILLIAAAAFSLFLVAYPPDDEEVQRLAVALILAAFLGGGVGLVAMSFRR